MVKRKSKSRKGGITGANRRISLPADFLRRKNVAIVAVTVALTSAATVSALGHASHLSMPSVLLGMTGLSAPLSALEGAVEQNPKLILAKETASTITASLQREPVNPRALRLLAIRAEATNAHSRAMQISLLGERLSRRDAPTQFILIESAVNAGDYREALRHYDIIMRSSEEARPVLFPVLAQAIADETVRKATVPYVRNRANWMPAFIDYAAQGNDPAPREITKLILLAGAVRDNDMMRDDGVILLTRLVDAGEFDLAKALFEHLPSVTPTLMTRTSIDEQTTNPSLGPIGWSKSQSASEVVFEQPAGSNQRYASIVANASEKGVALRRLLALRPGRYLFDETRKLRTGDQTSHAIWRISCMTNGTLTAIWTSPPTQTGGVVRNAPGPDIPASCRYQLAELAFDSGKNQEGFELVIENFLLHPAN